MRGCGHLVAVRSRGRALPAQPGPVLRERERKRVNGNRFGWFPEIGATYVISYAGADSIVRVTRVNHRRGRVSVESVAGVPLSGVLLFDVARLYSWRELSRPGAGDPFAG